MLQARGLQQGGGWLSSVDPQVMMTHRVSFCHCAGWLKLPSFSLGHPMGIVVWALPCDVWSSSTHAASRPATPTRVAGGYCLLHHS